MMKVNININNYLRDSCILLKVVVLLSSAEVYKFSGVNEENWFGDFTESQFQSRRSPHHS